MRRLPRVAPRAGMRHPVGGAGGTVHLRHGMSKVQMRAGGPRTQGNRLLKIGSPRVKMGLCKSSVIECARTDGGQPGHAVDLSWRAGKRAPAPLFIASSFLFSLSFGYVKTGSICVASAGDVAHSPSSFQMALCIFWTVTSGIKDLGCTFLLHLSWGGNCFHLPG